MGTIKADTVTGLADPNKVTLPSGAVTDTALTIGSTTATLNFGNTVIANASAGSSTITGEGGSTTTNLQQGLAKAWSGIDANSSVSQYDSFNIASITDTSAGLQSHNLTNAFTDTEFCCTASCNGNSVENFGSVEVQNGVGLGAGLMATRSFKTATNAVDDLNFVFVIGHGDLA